MKSAKYPGSELELFRFAQNWKKYFSSIIKPYLHGDVLEVGAGNGSTTELLIDAKFKSWTCLEPDPDLANQLGKLISSDKKFDQCRVCPGTIQSVDPDIKYNVILYIDVLEHIEADRAEIKTAASLLDSGGFLVVLAPAHTWLYSEFDKSIGHYRRYNKKTLAGIIPGSLNPVTFKYLDSAGILVSLLNSILLHKNTPSKWQILFWDKVIVSISRLVDAMLFFRAGKSIVGVWKKI